MSENLQLALEAIALKVSCISPELIDALPKSGQLLLRSFLDKSCLAEDIRRRNSLFCDEVFNQQSGKNVAYQDENVLALWVISALIKELFDEENEKEEAWFFAQKEKIVDLFEKEPFFAIITIKPEPLVVEIEAVEEPVVIPEKPVVEEVPVVVDQAPPAVPEIPVVVSVPPPAKESLAMRLQKARAEIAEKAKSIDVQKLKSELSEKIKALHLKENFLEGVTKMKGWFRKK